MSTRQSTRRKSWGNWLDKQKSQPKFKVGDWIVNNEDKSVGKITRIFTDVDEYAYDHTNGYFHSIFEKDHHLWTLKDAKKGDVLVNGSNIFIFDKINESRVLGICHVNTDNGLFHDDRFGIDCFGTIDGHFEPATDEQITLLFKAMHKARYWWNRETLELTRKKDEFDIEIPFGAYDSGLIEESWTMPEGFHAEIEGNTVYVRKNQQQQSWSKEDKEVLDDIINCALKHVNLDARATMWLQSLKNRVFSVQESWSEEDLNMIDNIIRGLKSVEYLVFTEDAYGRTQIAGPIKWLQSLKERILK